MKKTTTLQAASAATTKLYNNGGKYCIEAGIKVTTNHI